MDQNRGPGHRGAGVPALSPLIPNCTWAPTEHFAEDSPRRSIASF